MKTVRYKVNGDVYNIPDDKSKDFESQYKDATIAYKVGEDIYNIPVSKKDNFLSQYKGAEYYNGDDTGGANTQNVQSESNKLGDFWDSFIGDATQMIGAGTTRLIGSTAGLLDKGAQAINNAVGDTGGMFGDIQNSMKDTTEELTKKADRYNGKGYSDLWKEGDYTGALGDIILKGAESLPMSIAAAVSGPVSGLAGIGAITASQKYDDLDESNADMGELAKIANSLLTGSAEALFGKLGAGATKLWMKSLYKTMGKDAAENAVKTGVMGMIKDNFKKYGILYEPLMEGIEEVSSQLAENITDKMTGADPTRDIKDGLFDSFIYGTGGGAYFSAAGVPGVVNNQFQKIKTRKDYNSAKSEFEKQFAGDPDVQIIFKGLESAALEEQSRLLEVLNSDPDLSDSQKEAAANLIQSNIAYRARRSPEAIKEDKEVRKEMMIRVEMKNYDIEVSPLIAENGAMQQVCVNGDNPVFITKGNVSVVQSPEGKLIIDKDNSDQELYYQDGDGKMQVVPPSQVTGIVGIYGVEDARANYEANLRAQLDLQEQMAAQEQEQQIENGDNIIYTDNSGKQSTGVVSDAFSSPEHIFLEDGSVVPRNLIAKAPIQTAVIEQDQPLENNSEPATDQEIPTEQQPVQYPLDKDGGIDYSQINDPQVYANALTSEFGEEAIAVINESIETKKVELEKAGKSSDPIKKRRMISAASTELKRLGDIRDILSPKEQEETNQNATIAPGQESILSELPQNDREFAEWALDESDNTDDLLSAYDISKKLSSVEENLPRWQQELLGKKVKSDSFYRFGDRNKVGGGFAKAWLKKDGVEIDTFADELSEYGVPVTTEDIISFMLDNPTNYMRKTSDLQNNIARKWSETATREAGVPIAGPESATGKVFVAMKQSGVLNTGEYKTAIESDMKNADDVDVQSFFNEWYSELSSKDVAESTKFTNFENDWTEEDYNEIYDALDKELNSKQDDTDRSRDISETKEDRFSEEGVGENNQSIREGSNPVQDTTPAETDRRSDEREITEPTPVQVISEAEQQVDTNPTEAQKEAGNYKKGHIKLNGFDITIENPAGSIRSGKDASGKEWSVTMQNTYGYIRGTEGVDGDHIDVYIGSNPESDQVFVVDQVNPDGSFDEHKVMMGFDSAKEAEAAYLSNYETGWQGLGQITDVALDVFKEWIESSHRKTKPFANYKQFINFTPKETITVEDIDGFLGDEVQKRMAKGHLDGKQNTINTLAYENIKNQINERDRSRLLQPDSGRTTAQNKVNAEAVPPQSGRDGQSRGRDTRKTDRSEQGAIQFNNEESGSSLSGSEGRVPGDGGNAGGGSHLTVQGEPSGDVDTNTVDSQSGRGGKVRRHGNTDGRRRKTTNQNVTRDAGERGNRVSDLKKEKDDALNDLKKALRELRDAGRDSLSISAVGLNPKQIEATMKVISSGARYGYALIKEGAVKLSEWTGRMKDALSPSFKSMNFSDKEIEAFISDMWEAEVPDENGVYKPIRQWAGELGIPRTKEIVRSSLEEKREKQIQAESVSTKIGDLDNIRKSLPFLLPEQHEDVHKTEVRFFSEAHHTRELAYGKGIMFTNGTGTGKTYTGLGIIKRFVKQGKMDILIVVPSQNKVTDWIKDGGNLGIEISALENTKSAGEGAVITTYANFGVNKALYEREFDLVVYDESHRLMENKDGGASSRTSQHYLISNRNEQDALRRLQKRHPLWIQESELLKELKAVATEGKENTDEKEKIELKLKEIRGKQKLVLPVLEAESKKASEKTKVLFLSATPFKDHFNLRYAEQYLFSYPEKEKQGYNDTNPEELFYLENFGAAYRMRYNRLEKSGENADLVARQEIEFSQRLTNIGVMSGRMINSEMDYSRDFPTVTGFNSEVFNNALNDVFNYKEDAVFKSLRKSFSAVFYDYNYSTKLFEVLKTSASIDRIKKHLDEGRKIVVFHRRRQGDVRPPFRFALDKALQVANDTEAKTEEEKENKARMFSEIASFEKKYTGLLDYEEDLNYLPVPEQLKDIFGDRAVTLNGDVSIKEKQKAVDSFNSDNSGVDIIVIQEESGKEGISLHDTTGMYQRVLMNMALPISSITALQIEGRTYRIGNETNAIFEYPLLGLDLEIYHFGSKLNKKLSTTENLAMGNLARDLLSSFANGVLEQRGDIDTNSQGTGGKEYDKRASSGESSLFDKAVSAYYNTIRRTAKTKSREGIDYFPTPEPIGLKMVEWGMPREDESFLEPSAGHGAIARWVPSTNKLTAIEPSGDLFSKLNVASGGGSKNILQERFEDYHIVNKHDVIVMNPPFGTNSKTAADHVEKAFVHLRDGGRLIAIVPDGASMNKRLDKFLHGTNDKGKLLNPSAILRAEIQLPSVTFERAGTNVIGKIIIVDKIEGNKTGVEFTEHVDLRDIKDVRKLFDNIRDLNMPDRVELSNKDNSVSDDSVSDIDANETKDVAGNVENIKHSKTGEDLFTVKLNRRIDKKEYYKVSDIAKRHNGYWSSYVSSFLFKSREDADTFHNEINSDSVIRFREGANVNEQFNIELQQQIDGLLPDRHVYKLGMPSEVLISAGIPDLSIELRADKLATKSGDEYVNNHPFELREVTDLPISVANPIAVFDSKTRGDSKVILTEIKSNGNNFVVAIQVNRKIGSIEVNSVRSIYPKDYVNDIYSWVNEGLLKWVDKEKALVFMSNSSNPADVNNKTKGFNSATKIIESFKNPTTQVGKIISEIENISSSLNTPIHIVRDVKEITDDDSGMQKKKRGSKGWYDPKTGEVYVVLPNAESVADAQSTVLHETVGHKGLRGLFGENFSSAMGSIFDSLPKEIQTSLLDEFKDKNVSAEEYCAHMAETMSDPGIIQKICSAFKDIFRKIGIRLKITDGDIMYMLWKSKNRLEDRDTAFETMNKIKGDSFVSSQAKDYDSLFRSTKPINKLPVSIEKKIDVTHDLQSKKERLYEGYVDRMISVKKLQDLIVENTGKPIPDYMNAWMYENTLSSRNGYEIAKYKEIYGNRLKNSIKKLTDAGLSERDVDTYVLAKHGLERNEYMRLKALRSRIDTMSDDVKSDLLTLIEGKTFGEISEINNDAISEIVVGLANKDYSGLTAIQKELGDESIEEFLAETEAEFKPEITGLLNSIKAINDFSLKKWFDSGMIDRASYDRIRGMFKNYVPLRGFDETMAHDVYEYYTETGSSFNNPLKKMDGRTSRAESPFPHLVSMAESSIVGGNKNLMKLHFYRMAQHDISSDNPSGKLSIVKQWYVYKGTNADGVEEWAMSIPEYADNIEEYRKNVEKHNEEMLLLESEGKATKKPEKLKIGYVLLPIESEEHIVDVKLNGERIQILVHGNPKVAQAVNGINDESRPDKWYTKTISWANRQMAANFTTRNPAFVISNLSRDLIWSTTALSVKESSKYRNRFLRNIPKASGALARMLSGSRDLTNPVDLMLNEFLENGGRTGYTALYSIEKYKKEIHDSIKTGKWAKTKKGYNAVLDFMQLPNEWAEDLSRFSTYMTSRQEGRTVLQSVSDAKEVTVNFNRKGSGAYGAGALKGTFLFFNAAIQSLNNAIRLGIKNKIGMAATLGGFAAAGLIIPTILSMLGADDDKEKYNGLPDYVRKNNLCIPLGWCGIDGFLKIPLPIELRAFYGIGDAAYRAWTGEDEVSDALCDVGMGLLDLLPLNPAGGTSNYFPDAIKPVLESYVFNEDFTGTPIAKVTPFNEYDPEYQRVYRSASVIPVTVAEYLNIATGGDEAQRGWYDEIMAKTGTKVSLSNPAALEHLFEAYFGGMFTTMNQSFKTFIGTPTGMNDFSWRNVPVVNRFYDTGEIDGTMMKVNEKYFDYLDDMKEAKSTYHKYENLSDNSPAIESAKYMDKLMKFEQSNEWKRAEYIEIYAGQINDYMEELKETTDDSRKKELQKEINIVKKEMVDGLKNGKVPE